jgi:hypothetical protein
MEVFENILTRESGKTPGVDFNRFTGELILSGKSIPENAAKIYEPLLEWIGMYITDPRPTTNLRLNLEYFNTATSIWLAKLVKGLCKIEKEDHSLYIHLYFDIEDFEDMDTEDLKDVLGSLLDNIGEVKISLAVKTYGCDDKGKVVRSSTILV